MLNLNNLTIAEFRKFVGDKIFTAVFRKQDGSVRTMNARLKVAKFVKGTQPEVTAKRNATLKAQNMIGVYEMATEQYNEDGSKKVGAEKYRTLNLDTLMSLKANGLEFGGE